MDSSLLNFKLNLTCSVSRLLYTTTDCVLLQLSASFILKTFSRHFFQRSKNACLSLVNQSPLIGYLTGPSSRETLISLY